MVFGQPVYNTEQRRAILGNIKQYFDKRWKENMALKKKALKRKKNVPKPKRRQQHRKITIRRRKRRRPKIRKLLGRGINRPYVDKRNRLMLGSGSINETTKQRGGFFPIGSVLAAAPPIIDLLGKIIK